MKELNHFLFNPPGSVDAICITTNGIWTKSRGAVMGKGVALTAATRWPLIKFELARKLEQNGNRVYTLLKPYTDPYQLHYYVLSFPTKEHWRDPSKISLVVRSAQQLVAYTDEMGWKSVWMTRPGCGCGGMKWSNIKPFLEAVPGFDDRFTVVYLEKWEKE